MKNGFICCILPNLKLHIYHGEEAAEETMNKPKLLFLTILANDIFQTFVIYMAQTMGWWGNKLHTLVPDIENKYYQRCTNRKPEVIMDDLRIHHTGLTHLCRMAGGPFIMIMFINE